MKKLNDPIGAIWSKKEGTILVIKVKNHGGCEIKEKFIAIKNGKKEKHKDHIPDYFLHVFTTHTGAAPLAPWTSTFARPSQGDGEKRETRNLGVRVTIRASAEEAECPVPQAILGREGMVQATSGTPGSLAVGRETDALGEKNSEEKSENKAP